MRRAVVAVVLLVVALTVPAAAADMRLTATADPTRVSAGTRVLTVRLEMQTGDREENFGVDIGLPRYASAGAREPIGSPLRHGGVRLRGPGEVGWALAIPEFPASACVQGATEKVERLYVRLPPASTSVLELRFRLLAPPARRRLNVRLTATGGTLPVPRQLVASAVLRGRGRPLLTLERLGRTGRSVQPAGHTARWLAGAVVSLQAARGAMFNDFDAGSGRFVTLARARVDRRGRFRFARWAAARPGAYLLRVIYGGGRRALPARSCPKRMLVRR